jgi:excisionase family DNA binding protein
VKTRTRRFKLPPKVPTLSPEMLPVPPVSPALTDFAQRSQPPPPMLLRIPEVARELGVSERTIQSYLAQGLLERVKLGSRTIRISRRSLMALMGVPAE